MLTGTPAAAAAATTNAPGSEIPGVPASETTATVFPSCTQASTWGARADSLCSWSDTRRPPPATPTALSRARVRRVSSQQMTSAAARVSMARAEMSPRLPIGVATSTSEPRRAAASSAGGTELERVPESQAPAVERPGGGLEDRAGAPARQGEAPLREPHGRQHHQVGVEERHVEREAHGEGVHGPGAGEDEGTVEGGTTDEAAVAVPEALGQVRSRQHLAVAQQPTRLHVRAPADADRDARCGPRASGRLDVEPDLEHVAVEALVVLPLDAQPA